MSLYQFFCGNFRNIRELIEEVTGEEISMIMSRRELGYTVSVKEKGFPRINFDLVAIINDRCQPELALEGLNVETVVDSYTERDELLVAILSNFALYKNIELSLDIINQRLLAFVKEEL